jgi:hypothetical protein
VDRTELELATLHPQLQPIAFQFIATLRDLGYPAVITDLGGRRNAAQQSKLMNAGLSRTVNSAHVQGRAFDLDLSGYKREQVPNWFWEAVGPWAESEFDLIWGGRWRTFRDVGHFQLPPESFGDAAEILRQF